ncbi:poly-gamma-glutamate synthase PgsB [Paratissierella segnis]|mgnify:CR=1 FL=1|uniref:Poly-gamma-glutamate synthase PgsB n=1 Tax=Paratissierella segnis TaxID=2763679 RepID=A0A926EZ06_9FIRM|nr:poly-gamma-glutamate synthase PgsB [Paratissierella segnis]MBC8588994.1 poly-gamma-glutamate synthase PgsB [Paratissierella segnis]
MEYLIILITVIYIFKLLIEKYYVKIYRSKLKHVIYVNGTRGKSTVTRLIYAGLKASDLRCSAKTTGTVPIYIDPEGIEHSIKRKGRTNIKEQIQILKRANEDNSEVLVIECMAITPELQYVSQHKMLKSDIGVITNVRMDHSDVMGNTLTKIAYSLSNTIPSQGTLFTTENKYYFIFDKICDKLDTVSYLVDVDNSLPDFDFKDNISLALAVCEYCGINRENALISMKDFIRDPYSLSIYKFENGGLFVNGLSINDVDSTEIVYNYIMDRYKFNDKEFIILINNRVDRGYRARLLIDFIGKIGASRVWISGDNRYYAYMYLKKMYPKKNIEIFRNIKDIPFKSLGYSDIVFAIGNIGKNGIELMDRVSREGELFV